MRLILYLGKGGVGKTTISAATAARCAEMGKRTLVVSTDIAHSLADALDVELGAQPKEIAPNLWAQEINAMEEVRRSWSKLEGYLATLLKKQGASEVVAEELAIIPGMEEIIALIQIWQQSQANSYDAVVIDAAPTGETVRLLSMPETFQWYANRIGGWQENALKMVKPFLGAFMPSKDVFNVLPKLRDDVKNLRAILSNPDISTYRLVVNPEKIVIKEAQRGATYLNLFGYPLDGVVVNRVLPPSNTPAGQEPLPGSDAAFVADLRRRQTEYLQQIQDTFAPLPIWEVPYFSHEIGGIGELRSVGCMIYGDRDPLEVFYRGKTQEIVKQGENYLLRMPLPHVELSKVNMTKKDDELMIEIGTFKREMLLPQVLLHMDATRARFRDGVLEVLFEPQAEVA